MGLVEELKRVLERKEELEVKRKEVLNELAKLKPESGTLEYKPVKNKAGDTYYYWYLRKWEGGKLKSIYLGKSVPSSLIKRIEDRKKARRLMKELRLVERELQRINRALNEVRYILSSL